MPEYPGASPNFFHPESYGGELGLQGRGLDAQAIQAAVNAAQQYPGLAGVVVLTQAYVLEAPVVVPPGPPVHFWFTNGAMNRQAAPPTFTGASLRPANGFAGTALLTIGASGSPVTNPH